MEIRPNIELFRQQAEFVMDGRYATAAVCGVGAGKSRAGSVKALMMAQRWPGSLGIVTAPTFRMLGDSTLRVLREVWPQEVMAAKDGWREGEMRMTLVNGSQVLFRSTEDPEHLRGPNASWAWMDEAAMSDGTAFQILQGRLREGGRDGPIFLTTTPKGYNWVYDEFVRKQRANYRVYRWSLRDNRYVSPEYIRHLEESYDAQFALQEIEGEFVSAGAVSFDAAWLQRLLAGACEATEPGENEDGTRVSLWAPYDATHEYVLGIDPKGEGSDLACAALIDWTFGEIIGEVVSRNRDATVVRAACVRLARRYSALCVPERTGVGAEWPREMLKAGCRVWKQLRDKMETAEHYRGVAHGWNTSAQNRGDIVGSLQRLFRQHRLSTRSRYIAETALSWDQVAKPHIPDILSAAGIGCAAGTIALGEMGSTVAQAARYEAGGAAGPARWGWGPQAARPFRVQG